MAAIDDLINKISDNKLQGAIRKELKRIQRQKKFGLVFEEHLPEATPLYDVPIKKGSLVAKKNTSIDEIYRVLNLKGEEIVCCKKDDDKEYTFKKNEYVVVAPFGEPIYPYLKKIDSVCNAPEDSLWHTLIEADNYHALQMLVYLYSGKVDCIYIDPPYNTGAKDWKYNNDYVDGSDEYRHSKWLSFMEKRLLLAKKLLNPKDSVLICTIDENEYTHLGCLLEEIFTDAKIQMISDIINPRGATRDGQFSRSDEYIFIIQIGNNAVSYPITGKKHYVEWYRLRRTDYDSRRGTTKGGTQQFYPIYVDDSTLSIVKIGLPLTPDQDRAFVPQIKGATPVFPINNDGTEMNWGVTPETLKMLMKHHFVRVRKNNGKPQPYLIHYISYKIFDAIENGTAKIEGYNNDGTAIVVEEEGHVVRPGSAWNIPIHNAGTYGSELLAKIIGEKRFSFPKSLYSESDTLRYFLRNKKEAVVVDFFAGSGTTLNAINLLNKEDNGKRRCIMVTNNEVSEKESKELMRKGYQPGDAEWEKWGIARYVNWPRTVCSINGVDVNNKPINGSYLTYKKKERLVPRTIKQLSFDIPEDNDRKKVKKQIVGLLGKNKLPQSLVGDICPYIVSENYSVSILFDDNRVNDWLGELEGQDHINEIYVNTHNNKLFKECKAEIQQLLGDMVEEEPVTFPMSDGFKSNCIYFKLGFLDKNSVAIGRQFTELISLLWMKAGCIGKCPEKKYETVPSMLILPENKFAVLTDEMLFAEFKEKLSQYPEIGTVYLITDSESNYLDMIGQLSGVSCYQLYRDYLDNFTINYKQQ